MPGIALGGLTIIVSPLVALMKDQVENLRKRDISAVAIYSGMPFREIDIVLDNCIYGRYNFLYVSPERLQTELFIARVAQMPVKLIAVDEAHCISQWGYDFRPEYLKVAILREHFPHVPIIALTATATPDVADDIQHQLQFSAPNLFQAGFGRPNLHYLVLEEENKLNRLVSIAKKTPGTGIVYVRSRFQTQKIAQFLSQQGINATYYHAGLDHKQRDERQHGWAQGKYTVIVATNAFGMGIDKPDVRFVVHMEPTDTLENYFQEAGRAGRDGAKSYCVMLYTLADGREALEKFEQRRVTAEDAKTIVQQLHTFYNIADGSGHGVSVDFDIQQFANRFGWHLTNVYNLLKTLEQQGIITLTENVYYPPKIMFLVDNYGLYEYQVKYPLMTEFVKTILRSYGGAFEQYITINEAELGTRIQMDAAEVQKRLLRLHENGILDYQPLKELPQLTFNFPRGIEMIDNKTIENRAALLKEKLQAVLHYCGQTEKCRQQLLLDYFGEKQSAPCGKCDVCMAIGKKIVTNDEFEEYRTIIETELDKGPIGLIALAQSKGIQHQAKLADAVRKLAESGQVTIKEGWVYRNEK